MIIGIEAKTLSKKQKTGVENYIKELIKNLAKLDTQNEYWLYTRKKISKIAPNFKVKIVNFPFAWTQLGLSLEFLKSRPRPEIFLSTAHSLPLYCPIKSIVTIHDLAFLKFPDYFTPWDYFRLKTLTKEAVKRADKIIAVSQNTKQDIVKYYHIRPQKIVVIHLGYDKNVFKPVKEFQINKVRKKYRINNPYLIYIGTLQKRKNIPRLISAFNVLKKKYQIPHQLVIVGKKGWLYDEIFQKIEDTGLGKEVIFTGFVKDNEIPILLSGAELFVLPSLYEGFGLPILEAMACGAPVVTSNVSSMPELIADNGVLVNPKSISSIAKGIYKIISSPDLAKKLSQRGLKRVKDFNWQKCSQETLEVIKSLKEDND